VLVCVQHIRPLVLSNKAPVYSAVVSNLNTHILKWHYKEHMEVGFWPGPPLTGEMMLDIMTRLLLFLII